MKLTLKLKNELQVLDAMTHNPGIGFTQALKKSGMHRKTFYEALKRLQQQGVVEKYSWGKKKAYSVNIPIAQIYLYKLGKLGLGTRYDKNFYFKRKITREHLTLAKDIIDAVSCFGFNTIEKWRCPIIQHGSEKIVYCLTENGVWAYCSEIGCKYGVYGDFTKYGLQMQLEREGIGNGDGGTVTEPQPSTADYLKAVINSNEFQVFCSKKCPLKAWEIKECKTMCPILTMRETLLVQNIES